MIGCRWLANVHMILDIEYDEGLDRFVIPVPDKVAIPAINDWPGWKRSVHGNYSAPAWVSAVLMPTKLRATELRWTPRAANKRDSLLRDLQVARDSLQAGPFPIAAQPTERKPKKHQLQGVHAMRNMGWRVLLEDEMGLGKTSTALWAADDARQSRLLVFCPVSAKYNWQDEIIATLGNPWIPIVVDGTSKKRASQFAEAASVYGGRVAIIINYDLLRHLPPEQMDELKRFVTGGMMLCDESHYLKSRDAERTKITKQIAECAKYVTCITGTPIRNLADDLYSQIEIIRPGTWTSFSDFAKRHLVVQTVKFGKREVRKIVGTRNLTELNAVVNTFAIKRLKSEVSDLPPKTYTYPELQLEGELLKVYNAMKDFAKIELQNVMAATDDAAVTIWDPRAKSAVEAAMRCEQIAQGFIGGIPEPLMAKLGGCLELAEKIPGRPHELMFPSSPKITWLLETIATVLAQGGAPIIPSRFNAPMVWLDARLNSMGVKSRVLHGGLSAAEKHLFVKDFQGRQFDVLLVQVKIAEAWNATRCQDMLFLGRDWSPAINRQCEDRAHREGQKGTVNVQIPLVRKTIEVMIDRRLKAKDADATQALKNLTIAELMEAL